MSIRDRIKKAIEKWLIKVGIITADKPPVTIPTPDKPTPNSNAVGTDALPWNTINWIGQANGAGALPTKVLRSVRLNGNRFDLDYDTISDWNAVHHPDWEDGVDCYGRFLIFTNSRNGSLEGGHVDHLRKDCKDRDTANLFNDPYLFNNPMLTGNEELYCALMSNDNRNRTNMVKVIR